MFCCPFHIKAANLYVTSHSSHVLQLGKKKNERKNDYWWGGGTQTDEVCCACVYVWEWKRKKKQQQQKERKTKKNMTKQMLQIINAQNKINNSATPGSHTVSNVLFQSRVECITFNTTQILHWLWQRNNLHIWAQTLQRTIHQNSTLHIWTNYTCTLYEAEAWP